MKCQRIYIYINTERVSYYHPQEPEKDFEVECTLEEMISTLSAKAIWQGAVLNFYLSHAHLHLSPSLFTGPTVMSNSCVKIAAGSKKRGEGEGGGRTGAGSESSNDDGMKAERRDKRGAEYKRAEKEKAGEKKITKLT